MIHGHRAATGSWIGSRPLTDVCHEQDRENAPGGDYPCMTAAAAASPLPSCFRCGAGGEIPIRPHGLAMCQSCYRAELSVTVDTGELQLAPA